MSTASDPAIQVRSVRLHRSNPKPARSTISFSVVPGEICGLVGPNGAAKSSLLRAVAGLDKIRSGVVNVSRRDPLRPLVVLVGDCEQAGQDVQASMGTRGNTTTAATLGQFVASAFPEGPSDSEVAAVESLLHEFDLGHWRAAPVNRLSQGVRHKALLARALVNPPVALLLDEPWQYLDPRSVRTLNARLRRYTSERQGVVLLATRQPDLAARLCHRVVVLREGRLVCDTPVSDLCHLVQGEFYQLLVRGEIDDERSSWIGGLALPSDDATTLLSVIVADQVALHGLLAKLRDLSIPILSLSRVDVRPEAVLAHLMHAALDEVVTLSH